MRARLTAREQRSTVKPTAGGHFQGTPRFLAPVLRIVRIEELRVTALARRARTDRAPSIRQAPRRLLSALAALSRREWSEGSVSTAVQVGRNCSVGTRVTPKRASLPSARESTAGEWPPTYTFTGVPESLTLRETPAAWCSRRTINAAARRNAYKTTLIHVPWGMAAEHPLAADARLLRGRSPCDTVVSHGSRA